MGALIGMLVKVVVGEAIKNKLTPGYMSSKDRTEATGKGMVQSKTVWGVALASLGPVLAPLLGLDDAGLQAVVSNLTVMLGAALAIWGRFTAKKKIG